MTSILNERWMVTEEITATQLSILIVLLSAAGVQISKGLEDVLTNYPSTKLFYYLPYKMVMAVSFPDKHCKNVSFLELQKGLVEAIKEGLK